ncbi:MAG: aldo/keto reductase [Anaerolineae bacterium]
MEYRKIGQTDLEASVVSLGGWAIATDKTWGAQDEATSIATIHAALDAGINYFDTAEGYGYGKSEEYLGKALARRRQEVLIVTKVEVDLEYVSGPQVIQHCEASLRRLNTDYIDIYRIHWPSRITPLEETVAAIETLRQQGKVRYLGVANFGAQDMADLLALGQPVGSNEFAYNLLFRPIEYAVQPKCLAHQISIFPYSPLAQGLLTGKFASADEVPLNRARTRHFSKERQLTVHGQAGHEQATFAAIERIRAICQELKEPMASVALAWLLYQPGVTSVIAGARNPAQVNENVRAAYLALSNDILKQLMDATADLKAEMGPNPDMWRAVSRIC